MRQIMTFKQPTEKEKKEKRRKTIKEITVIMCLEIQI